MPCLWEQYRSRSVGFWRSQLMNLHCLLFRIWICISNLVQVIWLADNKKWAWHFNLTKVLSRVYPSYPKHFDRKAWASSVDLDQMLQNMALNRGLHCLPLIQQCLGTLWNRFVQKRRKINDAEGGFRSGSACLPLIHEFLEIVKWTCSSFWTSMVMR